MQLNPNLRYGVNTSPVVRRGFRERKQYFVIDGGMRGREGEGGGRGGGEGVMMEADVRAWLFPRAGMGAQFLPTPRDRWLPTFASQRTG